MSEAPLMNDDSARTPMGEILDQAAVPPTPAEIAAAARAATDSQTTTTETTPKPITDPAAKPAEETKPAPSAGAPEAYADFTAPEGYKLDAKAIEAALPVFKEMGLNQEQAQKLVTMQANQMIEAAKAPTATYETMRRDWRAAVDADADIKAYSRDGKSGLDAVKIDLGRAMATLPESLRTEFKAAMDLTGAGDNPAFVKAFWKMAQQIAEPGHVGGKGPSLAGQQAPGTKPPTTAQALYPNLPSAAAAS